MMWLFLSIVLVITKTPSGWSHNHTFPAVNQAVAAASTEKILGANSPNTTEPSLAANETAPELHVAAYVTMSSYIILMIVTIAGNFLVIAAFFKEPTLQAITNYWIVSLSLTDIILASTVMPLQIKREYFLDEWLFGEIACDIFICLDVLCCTCSIYHLGLISLDRYFCVRFPIRYPCLRSTKKTVCAIFLTWCWCTLISIPRLLGWKDSANPNECQMSNKSYMLFSSFISFYIPLFLSACMYLGIYRLTKERTRKFRRELAVSMRVRDHVLQNQNLLASTSGRNLLTSNSTISSVQKCEDHLPTAHTNTTLTQLSTLPLEVTANMVTTAPTNGSDESTMTGIMDPDQLEVLEESDINPNLSPPIVDEEHHTFHFIRSRLLAVLPVSLRIARSRTAASLPPPSPSSRCSHPGGSKSPFLSTPSQADSHGGVAAPRNALQATRSDTNIAGGLAIQVQSQTEPCTSRTPDNQSHWRNRMNLRGSDIKRRKKTIAEAKLSRRRQKQEVRAARVVVIVFGAFVAFWMPFFLVNTIEPLCSTCRITRDVWKWVTFWGYVNSAVNPFIYTFFNRTFRRAIFSVIRCEKKRRR